MVLFSGIRFAASFTAVAFLVTTATAQQGPAKPESDDEVLVVLPKSFLANRDELTDLRGRLSADPDNPKLASDVAGRYLALGNRTGDPRFYGYARAAINRWWESDSADPLVLQIRAKLKEKDHLYDDALADLQAALKQDPDDPQALLEVGNIYRVKGRYEDALTIAEKLQAVAGDVPALLCRAPVMAQTGEAKQAYDLLSEILPEAREKFPSTVQFILTIRAEIAEALGRDQEVEQHFTDGLAKDETDFYMLRGYSDYLLDHDRAAEALALLQDQTADTGILLRAAIAAKATGDAKLADEWTKELQTRFEEIRLRGGKPHGRFESRSALHLNDDPAVALQIALDNWQQQKEVRDTRNVLEAAIAAGDNEAAEPVIEFLNKNQNEHVVLKKLMQELEAVK